MYSGEQDLAGLLDRLYCRYNRRELVPPDPLQFVYRYKDPADQEIVAFLSAAMAYGRVEQIEKSLDNLFGRVGRSPRQFVLSFGRSERRLLKDFKHRFTTGEDVANLLDVLAMAVNQAGGLEGYFLQGYRPEHETILPALDRFCTSLLDRSGKESTGLQYLLARPSKGSPCKRLNMFLRWMVRKDGVDLGLWSAVDPRKLIVPMDTHMIRLCRILGLYDRKTVSMATALQVTQGFARVSPEDPVKYDFALSRIGILEGCTGRQGPSCHGCDLVMLCR